MTDTMHAARKVWRDAFDDHARAVMAHHDRQYRVRTDSEKARDNEEYLAACHAKDAADDVYTKLQIAARKAT